MHFLEFIKYIKVLDKKTGNLINLDNEKVKRNYYSLKKIINKKLKSSYNYK